jgi:hypothetical protein
LEDNNPIFRQHYRLSEIERVLVQAQTVELLDTCLVELLRSEYVLVVAMLAKKDIFSNWTK